MIIWFHKRENYFFLGTLIFVREYAKKHKLSYMCAMSEPDCSKQYIISKGKTKMDLSEQVIDDFVSFSYLLKGIMN